MTELYSFSEEKGTAHIK